MPPGSTSPPLSRGILDRPGGKPDGAEQAWEFRELGGGPGYGPPSLWSVWENVSLLCVSVFSMCANLSVCVNINMPLNLIHPLPLVVSFI